MLQCNHRRQKWVNDGRENYTGGSVRPLLLHPQQPTNHWRRRRTQPMCHHVWPGRASQGGTLSGRTWKLHQCIRPLVWGIDAPGQDGYPRASDTD